MTLADVLRALGLGRANARTTRELCRTLGCDARALQAAIEELRALGECVCSGSYGYWLAASVDEARGWEEAQRRRILSMFRSMRGVRRGRVAMQAGLVDQRTLPWA